MRGHTLHPTLLREYDIRGVVGETLFPVDAMAVGQAFGTRVVAAGGTGIAVGRDGRDSSPALEAALVEGLAGTGLAVHRLGCCPTPALYFAVHHLGTAGGVMITGSHNPPAYNGIKMMFGTGPFFGADIVALGKCAASGRFATGKGRMGDVDVSDAYVARLLQERPVDRDLRVVWDCGNGASGPIVESLCRHLPGEHQVLFATVDGRFPNHHPDPTVPENLEDLIAAVRKSGADLGVAFDGDGDRIGVVDDAGRILWADQLLALLAEAVLADHPGASVIADVKASRVLFDRVAALGGDPVMWRTGHAPIRQHMARIGAPLAGEMSGHMFFGDRYFGFDDGPYAAMRTLSWLAGQGGPLSACRRVLPDMHNTPEIRFPCPGDRKFAAVEATRSLLGRRRDRTIIEIDGVRVQGPDGWWLLRASNTQDMLVVRCESDSVSGLDRLWSELSGTLRWIGIEPPALPGA